MTTTIFVLLCIVLYVFLGSIIGATVWKYGEDDWLDDPFQAAMIGTFWPLIIGLAPFGLAVWGGIWLVYHASPKKKR